MRDGEMVCIPVSYFLSFACQADPAMIIVEISAGALDRCSPFPSTSGATLLFRRRLLPCAFLKLSCGLVRSLRVQPERWKQFRSVLDVSCSVFAVLELISAL